MAAPQHFDPRRALVRVSLALAVGAVTYLSVCRFAPTAVAVLLAWNVSGFVLLALVWTLLVAKASPEMTRKLAGDEDPGRTLVYAIVLVASSVSLIAATLFVRQGRKLGGGLASAFPELCLMTVALAWAMTHTAFTLRYARLYYREDAEGVGGLELPGDQAPAYFDFAYFAFTIGMCFQVSDMTVTSRQIRRAVLLHALISFAYNTLVLAFVLNLVFGSAS